MSEENVEIVRSAMAATQQAMATRRSCRSFSDPESSHPTSEWTVPDPFEGERVSDRDRGVRRVPARSGRSSSTTVRCRLGA